jgi:basic membrane protein A
MKKFLAITLTLMLVFALVACTKDSQKKTEDFKVGVILVHDDNSGYDLAHLEGIKAAAAELGLKDE